MKTSTIGPHQAQEGERRPGIVYRNIANAVSLLGIIPLPILVMSGGYTYVIPLMIYNNIMDDLDGMLAVKLGIQSEFGAILDNVCDALAHSLFVMVIAMHHGVVCGAVSVVAILAIELRVVSRLRPVATPARGSPTNELVRHMLFVLLLAEIYTFAPTPYLIAVFILHAISMIAPLPMPYLLRGMTKSAVAIAMINLALLSAWLLPISTAVIAACFFATYLFSFAAAAIRMLAPPKPPSTPSGDASSVARHA
jgi:phosphatidylglycerophosphate synthase